MTIQEEYEQLKEHLGESNIKIEFIFDDDLDILHPEQYSKIKLTHFPTKKVILGINHTRQIQNAVDALKQLKSELSE